MKIETKYDIGQEVWYIANGYIGHDKISGIEIKVKYKNDYWVVPRDSKVSIQYHVGGCDKYESQLFHTKEELLKNL